jgi:uncharacterized protein
MQKYQKSVLYSASDLVNFAACSHLTHLDLVNLRTPLPKAEDSEEMVLIQAKGFEHEARYLDVLSRRYGRVVDLKVEGDDVDAFRLTVSALREGAPVLFQATLLDAPWVGHADFLLRVDTPSLLGAYSYEVVDTKLARSSRAKFLLQLCLYSELLDKLQGVVPRRMHVVLGDGRQESFQVDEYLRYYRRLKSRFLAWVGRQEPERDSYPERTERCAMCRWRTLCQEQWERDDHLNRVAGITRVQIARLREGGVLTLTQLAEPLSGRRVERMHSETLERLAHQARLQAKSVRENRPVFDVLPLREGKGFNRLPTPAEGDLFFDMEGDPLEDGGLEYLFGLYWLDGTKPVFKAIWAHDRTQEREAFEAFIDYVTAHLARWPGAHIYHYAPYERTALQRLMALHGTREAQVDDLLRRRTLVDLYAVVREALHVGESSYSIKSIERFYGSARAGDVTTATASIVYYERWKASKDETLLRAIEDYNHDDVRSTYELRQWLLSIRPRAAAWANDLSSPASNDGQSSSRADKAQEELESYRQRLLGPVTDDPLRRSTEDELRELLFHLLSFHRRCDKPVWWAHFDRQESSEEQLIDDVEALAGLRQSRPPVWKGQGFRYWYHLPEQDTKLKTGDNATVVSCLKEVSELVVDETALEVSFVFEDDEPLPQTGVALGPGLPIQTTVIRNALKRFVDAYIEGGEKYPAGLSLLRRQPPKVEGIGSGQTLVQDERKLLPECIRLTSRLSDSYLFIQGPPGAGKTFTGSHIIVELLRSGRSVGVASNSHKAINNLLQAVERAADACDLHFRGAKKSTKEESFLSGRFIEDVTKTAELLKRVDEFQLLAGTAWLFSNRKLDRKLDYLFVDEAGQVSLANLLAMSTCARNLVLLGDQMQLSQPIQGVHPGASGQSTLDYLLCGEATIAPHMGVFLRDSWRMHPDLCRFISHAVYDGRLCAAERTANQRLVLQEDAHPALRPTGLAYLAVEHEGCSQRCEAEAEMVSVLVRTLLQQRYVDHRGEHHPLSLDSILVVAPYNLQVNLLKRVLPEGARVGTVDKFQGQEAEVVIVSMTTSSGQHLPRDIEFLYSKNRLNVAISRARCLSVVLASPRLFDIECRSPGQMALVNTLCWIREYAEETSRG